MFNDDYKGHSIKVTLSNSNPIKASYTVLEIGETKNYRGILDGELPQDFETAEDANLAVMIQAKKEIDKVLNNPLCIADLLD